MFASFSVHVLPDSFSQTQPPRIATPMPQIKPMRRVSAPNVHLPRFPNICKQMKYQASVVSYKQEVSVGLRGHSDRFFRFTIPLVPDKSTLRPRALNRFTALSSALGKGCGSFGFGSGDLNLAFPLWNNFLYFASGALGFAKPFGGVGGSALFAADGPVGFRLVKFRNEEFRRWRTAGVAGVEADGKRF